ncbi:sigma-E factor regulatory protein RseB domain-containing protein [Streptomyces sp. AK02-01A]|uniref:LolA family protein n=1 Tax=Streptomyces sp. AK02-01A TaxID=3028648 RepID=UPI0029A016D1|nr:sigma-E factor regulatory protein RseB domain-containing protein [Streptomyces sp. AK02-01A]MDX3851177.1 sigma-E factor regulatory protein RseB domain-containing protein [Streptomyces sp. AK02-01A]
MAPKDSAQTTDDDMGPGAGRRKAARYAVPVAVAGVAAATIGLVPALAAQGEPELPKISAQQLIEKIAASGTEQLSGSVKITTDLGLPSLGGLDGAAGSAFASGGGEGARGSSADPNAKLMELSSGTHTLRVAADGPGKQRVSILEDAAEYSLVHNGDEVWAYDSASNEAYHATAPKDASQNEKQRLPRDVPATPQEFAAQAIKAAGDTTSVSVDGTSRVAGRDAYQLLIKPKQAADSTVGSIRIAVDVKTGTPLKFTLSPSSGGKAVVDVGFTRISFAKPAAATFDFEPPRGAKVTRGADHKAPEIPGTDDAKGFRSASEPKVIGEGWNVVYELASPDVKGSPGPSKAGEMPHDAQKFVDALGDKVSGKFGTGRVFQTRLVNALMTEDGKVYVGAVTKDALVKAANQAG